MGSDDIVGLFQELLPVHGCVVGELFQDLVIELLEGDFHYKVNFSGRLGGGLWEFSQVEYGMKNNGQVVLSS